MKIDVIIIIIIKGAIQNEVEFGVGSVSVIEVLGFLEVIFLARFGSILTK